MVEGKHRGCIGRFASLSAAAIAGHSHLVCRWVVWPFSVYHYQHPVMPYSFGALLVHALLIICLLLGSACTCFVKVTVTLAECGRH